MPVSNYTHLVSRRIYGKSDGDDCMIKVEANWGIFLKYILISDATIDEPLLFDQENT